MSKHSAKIGVLSNAILAAFRSAGLPEPKIETDEPVGGSADAGSSASAAQQVGGESVQRYFQYGQFPNRHAFLIRVESHAGMGYDRNGMSVPTTRYMAKLLTAPASPGYFSREGMTEAPSCRTDLGVAFESSLDIHFAALVVDVILGRIRPTPEQINREYFGLDEKEVRGSI